MNSDSIIMNIDGKDMEMKTAICYDKKIDKWLVSECGKVWSIAQGQNKFLTGKKCYNFSKEGKRLKCVSLALKTPTGFWEDGSGSDRPDNTTGRNIKLHTIVMDTWAPLYDNPPVGVSWDEWEIARDLPTVFELISKTVVIDHKDDNPLNNHKDNLFRKTAWDNNPSRKGKGI